MADVKYRVDIDTKGAQSAINSLGNTIKTVGASIAGAFAFKEVTQTGAKLDDLRRTFGTLYKSVETGSKAFRDTQKLAEQLGLNVDTLATTVIKLKSAGIEPTVAQLKLFSDVSKSSVDSVGALQAITDLFTRTMSGGLGLEDLERLQDRGIPVYTILAEKAGIARNQISELGQTMEGASRIRGILAEGLNEMFGGATEARADAMSTAFTNLQNAIKGSSDSIMQGGLGQALAGITNQLANWINNNQELIQQIGNSLAKVMILFVNNLGVITKAAKIFFIVFAAKRVYELVVAMKALTLAMARNPIGILAVGALAAAEYLGLLDSILESVGNKIADMTGLTGELDAEFSSLSDNVQSIGEIQVFQQGEIPKAVADFSDLNQALKDFRLEQQMILIAFAKQNSERRQSINLESELLGKSREYSELRRAEADLLRSLQDEILKLQEAKAKLTEEEKKEGRAEVIDATIEKMREQYELDLQLTQSAIKNSEARKTAYEIEQYAVRESQRQQDALRDTYEKFNRQALNELEQAYYDIELAANASAQAQRRAMEAQLGRELTPEEANKITEISRRNNEELKRQHKELYDQSRTFGAGWKKAWKDYEENATNAAKTAERVFTKATQGMEDALVDFVKTGKFEWRDFVNMMLEELLRSQIRQVMASIFNPGSGGGIFTSGGGIGGGLGSIFSGIKGLFGFANGGMIPTNSPVLVGERGPELLLGAAGNRVIPNNSLGQTVNYYINAVDAPSFQSLVARDPSFIHAVAEQGRRRQPIGRR